MSDTNDLGIETGAGPAIKDPPDVCVSCGKQAEHSDKFHPFIVAVIRGTHAITREPMVRDGIFDENGKLAMLKACPACAPKVKEFMRTNNSKLLPKYLLRKLVEQIQRREKRRSKGAIWKLH